MEILLIAAKLLGVYLVLSGLFLIFKGKTVPFLLKDFFDHPAIVYLTGVTLVVFSTLLIIIGNNVWDGTWRVAITIIIWITLLKGLAYVFIPERFHNTISQSTLWRLNIFGAIMILVGVCLFYVQ